MGFVFSCFATSRGSGSHGARNQSFKPVEAHSKDRAHKLPGADFTLQPYLPTMSSNGKFSILLQADGYRNKTVQVEAYLDPCLKNSIISEDKARETNAKVTDLPEPVSLEDDQSRQYVCPSTIEVRWCVVGKETLTFSERFYVFPDQGDVGVAVRLRGNIEPIGHPASVHDEDHDLFVLAPARETPDSERQQKEHRERQKAGDEQRGEERKKAVVEKYGVGGGASNGDQGTRIDRRPTQ